VSHGDFHRTLVGGAVGWAQVRAHTPAGQRHDRRRVGVCSPKGGVPRLILAQHDKALPRVLWLRRIAQVRKFEQSGQLKLLLGNRVTELLQDEHGRVIGVAYEQDGSTRQLLVPQTVLATGGFANDRSNASLLALHRPDLVRFPTTNGVWATGDGMKMAMAIGAGTVDMDKVQVHPTGFVDPAEPEASTKVLCGEMMRGVGGLLVTPNGSRFVNELSPRDKVEHP